MKTTRRAALAIALSTLVVIGTAAATPAAADCSSQYPHNCKQSAPAPETDVLSVLRELASGVLAIFG